jgi:hypothetical protein
MHARILYCRKALLLTAFLGSPLARGKPDNPSTKEIDPGVIAAWKKSRSDSRMVLSRRSFLRAEPGQLFRCSPV